MPTPTYDLISSNILTSSASTVEFTSISGYRDLILVANIIGNTSGTNPALRLNSDTNNVYTAINMAGDSFGATGTTNTATSYRWTLRASTQPNTTRRGLYIANIMEVTTSKHKSIFSRANTVDGVEATAGRWENTSSVTSVSVVALSDSFGATSSFYLYGIVS